jgi:hypothetical protein
MTTALATTVPPTTTHPATQSMCQHEPPCPTEDASNRDAARVIARFAEQGWSLLCNGVVCFDDLGELLTDGSSVAPPSSTPALHRQAR